MARASRAFTLVELLLGMAVTSLIGLSAVTAGSVLTSRYARSEGYFESVQATRTALTRLRTLVCGSQLLLQVSSGQVLLWREQGAGDGRINPSELVLLTWPDGNLRQCRIVYPPEMSPIVRTTLDSPVSLSSVVEQPDAWAAAIRGSPYASSSVLASKLVNLTVSPDTAVPMSRMAAITLLSGQGDDAVTIRGVVSLRGDRTGYVAVVGGHYALVGS